MLNLSGFIKKSQYHQTVSIETPMAESLLSNPNTKIYIGAGWIKIFINLNR